MIVLILFWLLLFAPARLVAAVAFDAASSATCDACTSLSWSHTTSGSNRLLIVAGLIDQFFDIHTAAITSITYNAVTMNTKVIDTHDEHSLRMSYLVAPATGSNSVVITADQLANLGGGSVSYTGVDQSNPLGTEQVSSDLATGVSITVPTDGMAQDVVYSVQQGVSCETITVGAGQTQRIHACDSGFALLVGASTRTTSGTFTWTGATSYQHIIAVPINAAAAATVVRRRPILQ